MTSITADVKTVRDWALRNNVMVNGKKVGERGRLHADVWALYAAANGGTPETTEITATASVAKPATARVTAASVAREAALPKLGAGQGQYRRAGKLTDKDFYIMASGKEKKVIDVDVDGDRVVATMTDEENITHIVKFSADEMVRVL